MDKLVPLHRHNGADFSLVWSQLVKSFPNTELEVHSPQFHKPLDDGGGSTDVPFSIFFYRLVKLRAVDFKFRIGERFDELTPDKREVSSIVTVEGNKFIHKSTAKVEGVTGHTVITEFCGDKVTRYMTIDKVPDCIGLMKFERVKEGEEKETKEVDLQD
jgi:hypothetical protein